MAAVFTRELTDDLASLVKQIDKKIGENKKAAGFVVYLTDDPDAAEKELEAFGKKHGIENVPLTIFDGASGPPNYRIAKDAAVTVLLWERTKVQSAHAFETAKLDKSAVDKVVADAEKVLN